MIIVHERDISGRPWQWAWGWKPLVSGFGPRLFGFKRGDTDFRVSLIPLGGYVRMLGQSPARSELVDPASFQAKARWQKGVVIMAGPLMNIILAVVAAMTGLYMYSFPEGWMNSGPSDHHRGRKPGSAGCECRACKL